MGGCCQKCCGNRYQKVSTNESKSADEEKSKQQKSAEDQLLLEKCLIGSCKMSIDNLSWGNAGVFMLAWQATVVLPDSFAHYSVEWIIVGLTFVSGVILTVLPRLWEDPAEQRRELDIKYKAKDEEVEEEQKEQERQETIIALKQIESERNEDKTKKSNLSGVPETPNQERVSLLKYKTDVESNVDDAGNKMYNDIEVELANDPIKIKSDDNKTDDNEVKKDDNKENEEQKDKPKPGPADQDIMEMNKMMDDVNMEAGIEVAKQEAKEELKKEEEQKILDTIPTVPERPPSCLQKLWHFLSKVVGEEFEDLMVFTLSIVAAMALKTACVSSWNVITKNWFESKSETVFYYAAFVTIVGVTITIQLGIIHDKILKNLQKDFHEQRLDELTDEMMRYAVQQRLLKLSEFMLAMLMAWSWRDTVKQFGTPTGETKGPGQLWLGVVTISIVGAFILAMSNHFYFLYPKKSENVEAHLNSRTWKTITTVLYGALRFTVGMIWYDAIKGTMNTKSMHDEAVVGVLWALAIIAMVSSVVMNHFYKKWDLKSSIDRYGIALAIAAKYDSIIDDQRAKKGQKEKPKQPHSFANVLDSTVWELLELSIYAWGIAGALSFRDAVKQTVLVVAYNSYESDTALDEKPGVLWLSGGISLIASTIILLLLKQIINHVVEERKKLFKALRAAEEERERNQLEQAKSKKRRRASFLAYIVYHSK